MSELKTIYDSAHVSTPVFLDFRNKPTIFYILNIITSIYHKKFNTNPLSNLFRNFYIPALIVYLGQRRFNVCVSDETYLRLKLTMYKEILSQLQSGISTLFNHL